MFVLNCLGLDQISLHIAAYDSNICILPLTLPRQRIKYLILLYCLLYYTAILYC